MFSVREVYLSAVGSYVIASLFKLHSHMPKIKWYVAVRNISAYSQSRQDPISYRLLEKIKHIPYIVRHDKIGSSRYLLPSKLF